MTQHCALIMAGGTGGHIFPGLAVADALRERGWRVHWLGGSGTPGRPSMESRLVPPKGGGLDLCAILLFILLWPRQLRHLQVRVRDMPAGSHGRDGLKIAS
mgnify:CR=1 FL=1